MEFSRYLYVLIEKGIKKEYIIMQEILKKAKELCEEKPHLKKQVDEFVEECQQDKNLDVDDAWDKLYV